LLLRPISFASRVILRCALLLTTIPVGGLEVSLPLVSLEQTEKLISYLFAAEKDGFECLTDNGYSLSLYLESFSTFVLFFPHREEVGRD
jgi:hypothetical protein